MGTKTITMYVSDLDQSEIPAGQAYQLSIRHPDGSTQQLDISEQNYRDLKLAGVGKTLKKRGRKPGSTTTADSARASAAGARTANRPSPPDPRTPERSPWSLDSQADREAFGVLSMVEVAISRVSPKAVALAFAIVPSDRVHSNSEVVAPIDVVRRRAGNTATRVSSSNRRCLGDNCQSSAQTGPVGSRQLRLGRHSVECGLVGCSRAWWNNCNQMRAQLSWRSGVRPSSKLRLRWSDSTGLVPTGQLRSRPEKDPGPLQRQPCLPACHRR